MKSIIIILLCILILLPGCAGMKNQKENTQSKPEFFTYKSQVFFTVGMVTGLILGIVICESVHDDFDDD